MSERTLDVIFVGQIGNNQGGFYAINLKIGHQLKYTRATILSVAYLVIAGVHMLANKDKMGNDLH